MRKKKTELSEIQDRIWELCKKICRFRDGSNCYTCKGTGLMGSNQQTGHFIASSICGAYLRYDLRNLRVQCMRCNVRLSGNGAVFYDNLRRDHGQEYIDTLFQDKQRIVKAIDHYHRVLACYENVANALANNRKNELFQSLELLEKNF